MLLVLVIDQAGEQMKFVAHPEVQLVRRKTTSHRPAPPGIEPLAARTSRTPHGQRTSRPKAMPLKCSRPVAKTKPMTYVMALAARGISAPWAGP